MMSSLFGDSEYEVTELEFSFDEEKQVDQSEPEVASSDEDSRIGFKQKRKRTFSSDTSSDEESNKRRRRDDTGEKLPESSPSKRSGSQGPDIPNGDGGHQPGAASSDGAHHEKTASGRSSPESDGNEDVAESDGNEEVTESRENGDMAESDDNEDVVESRYNEDAADSGGNEKDAARNNVCDLFGDDISSDSEDDEAKDSASGSRNEEQHDEQQEERLPFYTMNATHVPNIVTNLDKNQFYFVKLPNFLSIEPRRYNPQTYEDEIDEDEVIDEEGRARLKLKIENTIRWRQTIDENGNLKKESNARFVRWSDGSMSLQLGSEVFDVFPQKLMVDDHNHVFLRHSDGLQAQGVFRTKLTFRPHSTNSSTHRKMLLSLSDRDQKFHKIQVLPVVGHNPEVNRAERIKKEEENLRASIRRENVRRKMAERSRNCSFRRIDKSEEDEEGAISLSSIKNNFKRRTAQRGRSGACFTDGDAKAKELEKDKSLSNNNEDDDDSDLDYFDRRKIATKGKKKGPAVRESDEED